MKNSIFSKTIYDKRWFIFGWALTFFGYSLMMAFFFPMMKDSGVMGEMLSSMPESMKGFVGDLSHLQNYMGYISSQVYDIRGIIFAGIFAVMIGQSLGAKEESNESLQTILSWPISRAKFLLQKFFSIILISFIPSLFTLFGAIFGSLFVDDAIINYQNIFYLSIFLWATTLAIASLTFAITISFGKKSAGVAAGSLIVALGYIVGTFSANVDWLKNLLPLSIFNYFKATNIAENGEINFTDLLILICITAFSLVFAWLIFRKRDIKVS